MIALIILAVIVVGLAGYSAYNRRRISDICDEVCNDECGDLPCPVKPVEVVEAPAPAPKKARKSRKAAAV